MGHARWKGGVGDRRQQRLGCVDRTPVRGRGGALSSLYSDDAAAAQHSYLAPAPATAPAVRRRKIRVRSKASPPRSMPPRAASTSWSTMRTPPGLSHMPICAPSTMISSTLCWRSIWRGPSPRCALAGHCLRRPGKAFWRCIGIPSLPPEEAAAKAGAPPRWPGPISRLCRSSRPGEISDASDTLTNLPSEGTPKCPRRRPLAVMPKFPMTR